MALGLKEINSQNKKRSIVKAANELLSNRVVEDIEKDVRGIRPWENSDEAGPRVRTLSAQEAIRKAKKIAERNEKMAHSFSSEFVPSSSSSNGISYRDSMNSKKGFGTKVAELFSYYLM